MELIAWFVSELRSVLEAEEMDWVRIWHLVLMWPSGGEPDQQWAYNRVGEVALRRGAIHAMCSTWHQCKAVQDYRPNIEVGSEPSTSPVRPHLSNPSDIGRMTNHDSNFYDHNEVGAPGVKMRSDGPYLNLRAQAHIVNNGNNQSRLSIDLSFEPGYGDEPKPTAYVESGRDHYVFEEIRSLGFVIPGTEEVTSVLKVMEQLLIEMRAIWSQQAVLPAETRIRLGEDMRDRLYPPRAPVPRRDEDDELPW